MFAVKFVGQAKRMCSLSGQHIILHGEIFDTIAQNVCRTAVFQNFEKLCESNSCYHVILRDCSFTLMRIKREISVS